MANHKRQQIREAVGTRITSLTTTGSNVFQSRVYPLETGNLPALIVYTKNEANELLEMGSQRTLQRNLSLVIEGYAKGTSNTDDTVDTIAKEVEVAMASDTTFGGLALDSFLETTEIEYNGEGEKPVGIITLTFSIKYTTTENAPDS
jgi:hypothetical protein